MIKKLKRQITFMLATIISLLIAVILVFVNIIFIQQSSYTIYSRLQSIISNLSYVRIENQISPKNKFNSEDFGKLPGFNDIGDILPNIDKDIELPDIQDEEETRLGYETFGDTSALIVNSVGTLVLFNNNTNQLSDDELVELSNKIVSKIGEHASIRGRIDSHFFMTKNYGANMTLVLITDDENITERSSDLINNSILIWCIFTVIAIWTARILASWLVKPVRESIENERAFVSDASHELKTPLAVISSNADALETEVGESKWLNCIKSESIRMSGLINNMLVASRVEQSNDMSTYKKIDFTSCVEEIVMNFEAPAFEKGVLINSEIQPGVSVVGSEEKLKQVVAILLDNAVKYVNEKGTINVVLRHRIGSVVLTVENTGSYVSKEDQKRIFERFYRADSSRTKNVDGERKEGRARSYGLGLAIAKRIVEGHEGNLTVSSTKSTENGEEKCSTTFKVVI